MSGVRMIKPIGRMVKLKYESGGKFSGETVTHQKNAIYSKQVQIVKRTPQSNNQRHF